MREHRRLFRIFAPRSNKKMKITPSQARQINQVLRIVAVHGMARVRDLYIEAGNPADFEGIHYVILMMGNELELLQIIEDGKMARITTKGKSAAKIGIKTYLAVRLSAKVVSVVAGICTILSLIGWLLQHFGCL